MNPTNHEKEGYRPVINKKRALSRNVALFLRTLRYNPEERKKILEHEDILEQAVYNPSTDETLNLEELSHTPLFDIQGFEGHPPEEFEPGTEPAYPPLSREQMRLLLLRTIPSGLVPFALERFSFRFEPEPEQDKDGNLPGPKVSMEEIDGIKKVVIKFNRDHFYSKGLPYRNKGKKSVENFPNNMVGFIDPTKISIFLGRIIAKMVQPPPEWSNIVNPNFAITLNKAKDVNLASVRKLREALDKKLKSEQSILILRQQWEDYVALAVTAPDLAQQYYPTAYSYFCNQMENFNSKEDQTKALDRLKDEIVKQDGEIKLTNIEKMKDLRTDRERKNSEISDPNLAWYERWIAGINRSNVFLRQIPIINQIPGLSSLINMKIIYTMPDDPGRAEQLAADDSKIKSLTGMDLNERDEVLGERLAGSVEGSEKARNSIRAYLIATANAGQFSEWRIHAWLYKFSETYRESHGERISEADYIDLEMIYSQSEKAGRLGSGVLPYEKSKYDTPDAKHYGRRIYEYKLKPRAEYVQDVQNKVRNESISTLNTVNEKVFDQFEHRNGYFDFNEKFSATPEGLRTQKGSLNEYLGEELGLELGSWLGKMGLTKISPDAQALAIAYYDEYKIKQRQTDRYVNPKALKIIDRYGADLNQSNQDLTKELYAIPAKQLSDSADFERIRAQKELIDKILEGTNKSLGAEISGPRYEGLLPEIVRIKITELLREGVVDADEMLIKLEPFLNAWYPLINNPSNKDERDNNIAIVRRNVIRFMYDPKVIEQLHESYRARKYNYEMLPPLTHNINATAKYISTQEPIKISKIIFGDKINQKEFDEFVKLGLTLTPEDLQAIRESDLISDSEKDKGKTEEEKAKEKEALTLVGETDLKQKERAKIIAQHLVKADQENLNRIIATLVQENLVSLKELLFFPDGETTKVDETYKERFNIWRENPKTRIFDLPPLLPILGEISLAVTQTQMPQMLGVAIEKLNKIITQTTKAVNFELTHQAKAKQPKQTPKPKPAKEEEAEEEQVKIAA